MKQQTAAVTKRAFGCWSFSASFGRWALFMGCMAALALGCGRSDRISHDANGDMGDGDGDTGDGDTGDGDTGDGDGDTGDGDTGDGDGDTGDGDGDTGDGDGDGDMGDGDGDTGDGDMGGASGADCAAGEERPVPCGRNGRGNRTDRCENGFWASGECEDSDECLDDTRRVGSTSCGEGDTDSFEQRCVLGKWQDSEVCLVGARCSDGSMDDGPTACGLNGRGRSQLLCRGGLWEETAICVDSDECLDAQTQTGASCGLNGRGHLTELCMLGTWQEQPICEDGDECTDEATRAGTASCGQNERGVLLELCVLGQWEETDSCADPDECIDDTERSGSTPCGQNQRGTLSQRCVSGAWQDDAFCQDADVCLDGATEPDGDACGLNERGQLLSLCVLGKWQASSDCSDPDSCVDGSEQEGSSPCGPRQRGRLSQECLAGAWSDTEECVFFPNILLVISDDVGAESSSLYPHAVGQQGAASMPHIEALAAEGIVFDNAWANPVCSPTRGTIMSGLYGNRTGVLTPGNRLNPSTVSLYDTIAAGSAADYALALFGKWHLAGTLSESAHAADMGLETFWGFAAGGIEDYFDWTALSIPEIREATTDYSTTAITDAAINYLTEHTQTAPEQPWFVTVAYNAAHSPFQVPPEELHNVDLGDLVPGEKATSVAVYQAMLEAMDTEIGRLLSNIDQEETVVIYIGDNGTPIEVKDPSSPVRDSKITTYQGGVWVPMVVAGWGVPRKGEREQALVGAVDLFATITSLAGVESPHENDGYDIAPLFTEPGASTGRTHAFVEHCSPFFGHHYAIRDQRYKLLYERRPLSQPGAWEMYDLENDPWETTNLYDDSDHQAQRLDLEAALAEIAAGANSGCFQ